MDIDSLDIEGAYLISPAVHGDDRGRFLEAFRADLLADRIGHRLTVSQANTSVSRRGVVRGVHFALVPPGQAKYVSCLAGTVLDVIVDVRVGSPTFGEHRTVELDAGPGHQAVYLSEGLGHAFCALSEEATVSYLCSTPYDPHREFSVHPLDPALGLRWPVEEPVLSARDAAAPSLADARAAGRLPDYTASTAYRDSLRPTGA